MIFNTAVMLGTRSILMQTKINFQIMNRQNLLEIFAGFIDELISIILLTLKVLLGFSQGAILSYAIALSHPEKSK
jgi:predicted esterase